MAIGGMAPDLVDQHLETECMRLVHEGVEIVERAEDGVHRRMVGDVVAEILLR